MQGEDGQVSGDDDAAREEDWAQHLVGRVANFLHWRPSIAFDVEMTHHVFDHDDRAVNDHPEVQCAQREQVCGDVAEIQANGGEHQRDGNCERNNDGAAHIAEKEKENDHNQNHSLGQVALDGVHRIAHQVRAVEKGNDLYALGQDVFVQFLDFGVNAVEDRIGVVALLQQDDAFHGVGIIDDLSVDAVNGFADLSEANLGTLRDSGDILDFDGRAVRGLDDGVLDVLHAGEEAGGLHVDLLRALLDETASAVAVVGGDLLLDLGNTQSVRDQLIGIKLDLVLLGGSA